MKTPFCRGKRRVIYTPAGLVWETNIVSLTTPAPVVTQAATSLDSVVQACQNELSAVPRLAA